VLAPEIDVKTLSIPLSGITCGAVFSLCCRCILPRRARASDARRRSFADDVRDSKRFDKAAMWMGLSEAQRRGCARYWAPPSDAKARPRLAVLGVERGNERPHNAGGTPARRPDGIGGGMPGITGRARDRPTLKHEGLRSVGLFEGHFARQQPHQHQAACTSPARSGRFPWVVGREKRRGVAPTCRRRRRRSATGPGSLRLVRMRTANHRLDRDLQPSAGGARERPRKSPLLVAVSAPEAVGKIGVFAHRQLPGSASLPPTA